VEENVRSLERAEFAFAIRQLQSLCSKGSS
jgi:hypothetical protein